MAEVPGMTRIANCLTVCCTTVDPRDVDILEAELTENGNGIVILIPSIPKHLIDQRKVIFALEDEKDKCRETEKAHDMTTTNIQKKKHLQMKKVMCLFSNDAVCVPFNQKNMTTKLKKTTRMLKVQLKEKDT